MDEDSDVVWLQRKSGAESKLLPPDDMTDAMDMRSSVLLRLSPLIESGDCCDCCCG